MAGRVPHHRFIVCPNSFKESQSAIEVAQAIEFGLLKSIPEASVTIQPIADGGEMTVDILTKAMGGTIETEKVSDPLGRGIIAKYGIVEKEKAGIIEICAASGFNLLKDHERNPLLTSTFGTGELIRRLLDENCKKIIVGLGGSATVDAGAGILQALGVRLLNNIGREIEFGGGGLGELASIDFSNLDVRIKDSEIIVLCDVENTLLGKTGAARVFAPQKGATPEMVELLENNLTRFNRLTKETLNKDMSEIIGGGAAGGIAATLQTYLGATLVKGGEYILEVIDIDRHFQRGGIVITGEGRFDNQTLSGKGPYSVATSAKRYNLPVVCLAGQVADDLEPYNHLFDVVYSISKRRYSIEEAILETKNDLINTAYHVGELVKKGKLLG